jgi:hypothetical protein
VSNIATITNPVKISFGDENNKVDLIRVDCPFQVQINGQSVTSEHLEQIQMQVDSTFE